MKKERREIVYSVVIIILVPVLLGLNTLLFTNSVRSNFSTELRRKADLINGILAQSVKQHLNDTDTQTTINTLIVGVRTEYPEVQHIRVVVPSSSSYTVVATTSLAKEKFSTTDNLQFDIVSKRKHAVAKLIDAKTDTGQDTRAWNVATPVIDVNGSIVAIVSTDVLTADSDQLIDKTFFNAYIIVIISTLIIVLLLIRHFRFVTYADLLRRQKEVNQTMGDFLSVATHELKAPMSIIKGYTANVLDGDYGDLPDKVHEPLNTIMDQTDRLNNLVTDLLNISRIEQGRLTFDMQPVDVVSIIRLILTNYKQRADEKQMTLTYEPPTDLPQLYADAGRVQEIMTNLIDNAIKYSVKGTVVISHDLQGDTVVTHVRDSGIGMSSEERARLFQRFYRVKNNSTKDISGTGLGLWIIKQYIEKMGGKIEVDSMVNAGTEFTVTLKKATIK